MTYTARVFDFFEAGIKQKLIKPVDLQLLTEMIHGNVTSLVGLCHKKTIVCNEEIISQAIEMSWDSVAIK